ncbi:hypothetical protein VCRA2128O102_20237 [Vibrio crassostreae]|nr:hypothetical protein VCRA2128O102_20237 [Vibrio crassostreae]CAK3435404.1 hypothetical protein VCRA2128O107_20237 [Vibrio crassostreae]CAK3595865.1 hypothetical protein VCRA2128O108_30237 [Vibrio crassostreae]
MVIILSTNSTISTVLVYSNPWMNKSQNMEGGDLICTSVRSRKSYSIEELQEVLPSINEGADLLNWIKVKRPRVSLYGQKID